MDARPEYKVTDPVPLNQDSRLVRRGNGTWRSAAWLTIQLVGSPTDVRPRFVNHDRRDFPLFFPPSLPLESWNRCRYPIQSLQTRFREEDRARSIFQRSFISFLFFFSSSFLPFRSSWKRVHSFGRNGINGLKVTCTTYIRCTRFSREDVVASVSIKERDCRIVQRWEECD